MAREGAARPHNRPASVGVVPQARVNPRSVTLPVVDGKGIRFTRLSTAEGLSLVVRRQFRAGGNLSVHLAHYGCGARMTARVAESVPCSQ
jgi:hypothetical protein